MEYGLTIPVVPRIEIPPKMPSRAFRVFFAISTPCGTEIVTRKPTSSSKVPPTNRTLASIFLRGTGLIAGPPTVKPKPCMVTVPTPKPPANSTTPAWSCSKRTSAVRWALSVQSGSSPASLMTMACAIPAATSQRPSSTIKLTTLPFGSKHSTLAGTCPVTNPMVAARAAAAAHAPVVNPVRVPRAALLSIMEY